MQTPVAVLGMGLHAVVFLAAVALALAVTAAYLVRIVLILWQVIDRLRIILAAVVGVSETSKPIAPIVEDINADLDAAREALEGAVDRLEQRHAPAMPAAEATDISESWRHWGAGRQH
jgi:hypothetical protein